MYIILITLSPNGSNLFSENSKLGQIKNKLVRLKTIGFYLIGFFRIWDKKAIWNNISVKIGNAGPILIFCWILVLYRFCDTKLTCMTSFINMSFWLKSSYRKMYWCSIILFAWFTLISRGVCQIIEDFFRKTNIFWFVPIIRKMEKTQHSY